MLRLTNIKLPLEHTEQALRREILNKLSLKDSELLSYHIYKRSYDARKKRHIFFIYSLDVDTSKNSTLLAEFSEDTQVKARPNDTYKFVAQAPKELTERPIVIGLGPCGLFVGLVLAQMGFKPIILERGKQVRERTVDTFGLWRKRKLNVESNVQFGEGGAGTFSDGKLYTQIKDPQHHGRKVLQEFVVAGAPKEILYLSKPHIGTFKLVTMVEKMRATIESLGGEIRFEQRVDEVLIENQKVQGVRLANGEILASQHIVFAVGHSARDTFQMLFDKGVYIEAKPFSIGFRIEHPQSLIDQCRFGNFAGHELLGAADYKLVHHCKNGRSVYSFCMCPGGTVVAATSAEGHLVTNGMSQYSRNERNANSAIVVGIDPEKDYPGQALAGLELQSTLEKQAFVLGGENYNAPAQLVGDFLAAKSSKAVGCVQPSYKPGVTWGDLSSCLPEYAITAIREALPVFDKKIHGFAMHMILPIVQTKFSKN